MKFLTITPRTFALLFLLATALPAFAEKGQHEGHGHGKGGHHSSQGRNHSQRTPGQNAKPEALNKNGASPQQPQDRTEARPVRDRGEQKAEARQEHREQHQEQTAQQSQAWQQSRGWQKSGAWQGQDHWEGGRARHWEAEHRTWAQRGGYGGYYIAREHYGLYFGREHFFRIHERPVIYMGYPRFVYHDYSFIIVDPWPEDWDENWYDSDDVYIEYDNGYYLYNRMHPGFALAVTVVE